MAKRLPRLFLLAFGILALATAVWGGLARMSIALPLPSDNANWITFHGPLMVCGFLGTVIGLERAVGLPNKWAYAAPVLSGAGSLILVAGMLGSPGPVLLTLGSTVFLVVTWRVVQLQKALFTIVMSLGAATWLVGNIAWLKGWPIERVVPFWIAFLGFTIVGERLDLGRFQKQEPMARPLFLAASGLFLAGLVVGIWFQELGQRLTGSGLLALALWLGRFDIARRTVRQAGLPRYMAICLLGGYVWLGLAGALMIWSTPLQSGTSYDAALHAFFVGFVFAMIFGHGPVIFPSVLGFPAFPFRTRFYIPVGLLHGSLALRWMGDLANWPFGRQWGGILNGAAIALFLLNTIVSLALATRPAKRSVKLPGRSG